MVGKKLFQATLLLGTLFVGCHSVLDRAEFGEECNALRKCNRRAFLWCNSTGVCDCSKPQSMLFDPTAAEGGKCLLKIGEICKVPLGEDESGRTTYQSIPCVRNSNCGDEGNCVCNPGFLETVNGTCEPMRSYLEDCSDEKLCNSNLWLLCATNGTCVCNQGTEYMPGKGCLGLPGKACNQNGTTLGCFYSSTSCINGICQCSSSEKYLDSTGCHAKKGLNSTCELDVECGRDEVTRTKLTCRAGTCDCDGETSVFGIVLQNNHGSGMVNPKLMCAPKYGKPCFKGYCSPGTKCEGQFDVSYSAYIVGSWVKEAFCKCPLGATWSPVTETCKVPFGGVCSSTTPCQRGMVCKRSRCSCPFAELEFDSLRGKCVARVGGPCETAGDCESSMECLKPVEGTPGECSCRLGYVETAENRCARIAGMTCSVDSDCDPLADLDCSNLKCACRYRAEYSLAERRCRGYVGTPCGKEVDCIDGADCLRSRKELRGVCRCRQGFTKTRNLTCISADGATTTLAYSVPETTTTTIAVDDVSLAEVTDGKGTTETFRENAESQT